jgi:hypothetical protein
MWSTQYSPLSKVSEHESKCLPLDFQDLTSHTGYHQNKLRFRSEHLPPHHLRWNKIQRVKEAVKNSFFLSLGVSERVSSRWSSHALKFCNLRRKVRDKRK